MIVVGVIAVVFVFGITIIVCSMAKISKDADQRLETIMKNKEVGCSTKE